MHKAVMKTADNAKLTGINRYPTYWSMSYADSCIK